MSLGIANKFDPQASNQSQPVRFQRRDLVRKYVPNVP